MPIMNRGMFVGQMEPNKPITGEITNLANTVEVSRMRGDKLARQVFTFRYDIMSHELVLDTYEYSERLSKWKKFIPIQQWRRDLRGVFNGGIEFKKIPLEDDIREAAKTLFIKNLRVVKEPKYEKQERLENERESRELGIGGTYTGDQGSNRQDEL